MSLQLNTSYKAHIIIGSLISLWLVGFLIVIAPFDASDLDLGRRVLMMPIYGVLTFLGYMVLVPIQNSIYHYKKQWTLLYKVIFILAFNILLCLACFMYYRTDIIRGDFSFTGFVLGIYNPIFFVLLSILIVLRWFLFKQKSRSESHKINIIGDNKLDTLSIKAHELVAVSSADNYVEIYYFKNGQLEKKLIRSTLKKISSKHPELLQTHRSHLINPIHLTEWKDSKTVVLGDLHIPVTKTYKDSILAVQGRP